MTDLDPTWLQARIEQTVAEMTDEEFDGMVLRTRAPRLEPSVKELVERELHKSGPAGGAAACGAALPDVGDIVRQHFNPNTNR